MTNKKSVVVTGASTGIGWGISKVLLARNFQVYGTVRKPADAARLVIGPGSVVTPIWDKAESADATPYQATEYAPILDHFRKYFIAQGRKGLPPEEIGRVVHIALTAARPKVRYAVVPRRLVNWTLPMLLPKRVLDKMIGKQLGLAAGNVSAVGGSA